MGEATNTTTKFIDHIGRKNNTARLIELGTLLTNLNNKKNQLEKIIDAGKLEHEELNEKIEEFNNLADKINQSIEERGNLTNKESLIKPVQKRELIKKDNSRETSEEQTEVNINTNEESTIVVPSNQPEVKIAPSKNVRGEPHTMTSDDSIEKKIPDKNTISDEQQLPQLKELLGEDTVREEPQVTQNNSEVFLKQLAQEMENITTLEEKLNQIDRENEELEKFIEEQEEIEKLEQLKKKALEAIALGKKAGLSKKELLAKGFKEEDINLVFNSKKK